MDTDKAKKLIKARISREKKELKRQEILYATDPRYSCPDYAYHEGRIRAFTEALEVIGMIDKQNNK